MYKITIERRETEAMVRQYQTRLKSVDRPLGGWGNWMVTETHRQFVTQTDPYGMPWAQLAPSTLEQKLALGYPGDILTRTGAMEDTIQVINKGRYTIAIGIGFPGNLHQEGTEKMPQRVIIAVTPSRRNKLRLRVKGYLKNGS